MLHRLTISALLKSVISATALLIVALFSVKAWQSQQRLQLTARIEKIAEVSAVVFKAMNSLRSDRSTTIRVLNADQPMDHEVEKYLHSARDIERPALTRALALLPDVEFPQENTLVPQLQRLIKTLFDEQAEFNTEVAKPKAQRRLALAKEYGETINTLLETLKRASETLEKESQHLGSQVNDFLARIRAA